MSKRRKDKQVQEEPKKAEVEYVSYRAFFANCVAKGMLKPWQEQEIQAFFKDLGLTDKEPTDLYLNALAKF